MTAKPLKVLHVEDSERDVALLTRHLRSGGYHPFSRRVETPEDFLDALNSGEWDVILCDYSMPHFSALKALELLRESPHDIPFIIISGTVGETIAVEAMRAGAHDYLMKDSLIRLIPAIEREMQEASYRRERARMEIALRDSEDRYRDLVEHSNDLICTHDLEGHVLSINPCAANLLGYRTDEIVGQKIQTALLPEFRERFHDYIAELKQQGIARGFVTFCGRHGEKRVLEYANTLRTEGVANPIVRGVAHDVTDRIKAERDLRESEARYRRLLDTSYEGVWLFDADLRTSYANQRLAEMLRVSIDNLIGRSAFDFLDEEARAEVGRRWQQRATGVKEQYDLRLVREDGTDLWVIACATPLADERGQFVGSLSMLTDITERKLAEQALGESERRYRLLFDHNPLPMWVYDVESLRFLAVNDAATYSYGYSESEFRSMTIKDIRPAEEVPALIENLAQESGQLDRTGVWKHRKKSGQVIAVEITSHQLEFAGKQARLVLAADVTERVRLLEIQNRRAAQAALRADVVASLADRESTLREVLRGCTDALVKHLDAAFARIWTIAEGADVLELEASSGMYTHIDGPHGRVRVGQFKIGLIAQERLPHITNDVQNDTRIGNPEWAKREGMVSFAGYPLMIEDRLVGVMALFARHVLADDTLDALASVAELIAQDIDRKRVREALRESEEQLRQSQKLEAIGILAGGIAHDFNNLLTAIIGYSDLSLRRLREEDPLFRNITEVRRAADRAAALTRQLLAFSRKQVMQPRVLNLNTVVTELEKMLRRLIGEDVELLTSLAPKLENVKADPGQIEQVIMNLAVNARDAMPSGGKLTIETSNVYLGETYARQHVGVTPGQYVMLAVTDTGTGMAEQTQARIFEPFFTTKEVGKGTGLGLSTVYGIVKQSGGNIWVYSEPNHGTTFKVYLPRVSEGAPDYPRHEEQRISLGSETILLAEDEQMVRTLAREMLEANGYKVLEAANGGAAMLICEKYDKAIDLLITDVIMPEMSGRELADRLRQLRPDMNVLFMSGYTDSAIVHQGVLDTGANFIQKPFNADEFGRKVREVLDKLQ